MAIGKVIGVGLLAAFAWTYFTHDPVEQERLRTSKSSGPIALDPASAMDMCRSAIKLSARDPEKAEVPYMFPESDGSGRWVYAWAPQTKMLRLRNGLGLDVAATGHCVINREKKTIDSLVVDNKVIL